MISRTNIQSYKVKQPEINPFAMGKLLSYEKKMDISHPIRKQMSQIPKFLRKPIALSLRVRIIKATFESRRNELEVYSQDEIPYRYWLWRRFIRVSDNGLLATHGFFNGYSGLIPIDPYVENLHISEEFCHRATTPTKSAPYRVLLTNKSINNMILSRTKVAASIRSYSEPLRMASNPPNYYIIPWKKWCAKHKQVIVWKFVEAAHEEASGSPMVSRWCRRSNDRC